MKLPGTLFAFALGLALGLAVPRIPLWSSSAMPDILRVSGSDTDTANPTTTGAVQPAAQPVRPQLAKQDSAIEGAKPDRKAARNVADSAIGFTAFVRSGSTYGAGILLDRAGHILTCHHVIEGSGAITVSFADSEPLPAKLVDFDRSLDIALLKVEARRATPARFASVSTVEMGDDVFGMGAPRKLRFSLSRGLVSYVGRPFGAAYYLQTDLPTNSGNSGGPVMNEQGEVVGITTFIFRDSQGLAFALPIDYAFQRFSRELSEPPFDAKELAVWQTSVKARASR